MAVPEPRPVITVDLRIAPEADAVRVVRSHLRSFLEAYGFTEPVRESVLLGFDEVLVNACEHAGSRARGETVELAVALFLDRLEIEVRDRGDFAARAAAADAALPGEDAESGRGLFLIQQTMDSVEWRSRDGGGTCVRLVKRR